MSYILPMIDSNGNNQIYGNEFEQMYRLELKENLQDAMGPIIDYSTGSRYTLYDTTDGIYNQNKLFENNDDPKEDEQVTPQQAMERVRNMSSINRPLTESEKKFNLYTNDNYDIRFRNQLLNESIKSKDNLFSEYSQDHVNAIRQSNINELNEDNLLYRQPRPAETSILEKITNSKTGMGNIGLSYLMDMAREEQNKQQRAQSFRDAQMTPQKKTMTEIFNEMIKNKNID